MRGHFAARRSRKDRQVSGRNIVFGRGRQGRDQSPAGLEDVSAIMLDRSFPPCGRRRSNGGVIVRVSSFL